MKLRVKYTGQLRTAVCRSEDEIELPDGSNVGALLRHVASELGQQVAPHLVGKNGHLPQSLLVVINETAVAGNTAAAALHDGDVVTLLPPIAGG